MTKEWAEDTTLEPATIPTERASVHVGTDFYFYASHETTSHHRVVMRCVCDNKAMLIFSE